MSSTGEVASYGNTVQEAYLKALKSTGFKIPKKAVLFGIQEDFQSQILEAAQLFSKYGLEIYATETTAKFLNKNGVKTKLAGWPTAIKSTEKTAIKLIQEKCIDLVINLPNKNTKHVKENYLIRRAAVDYGIGCISNLENAILFAKALSNENDMGVKTLVDYQSKEN